MTRPRTGQDPARFDRYGPELVRTALGIAPLEGVVDVTRARVVFLPSFHPEGALTATRREGATELELTALEGSLWFSISGGDPPTSGELGAWVATATLSGSDSAHLWGDLTTIVASGFPQPGPVGLDGISLHGELVASGDRWGFDAWSPRSTTPQATFVRCLYEAAAGLMDADPMARAYLGDLHLYLDLGLPLKDLPGPPRILRVFGGLSSDDEEGLRDTFAAVPVNEPVIVDMSNLDGMGGLLHGLFGAFASRSGHTAWVVSPGALPHLQAIGIPPARLFASVEAARDSLGHPPRE